MSASRRRLLNPGPVTLSPAVRQALATGADLCHREEEYAELERAVRHRLATVYGIEADYSATLLTGSGTAAVESMVTSLIPKDGNPIVAANGVYGRRIAEMLEAAAIPHRVVAAGWTDPIDFGAVGSLLAEGDASHVIVVHHETTTGRLNDLARLSAVAAGTPLLVDAVSSFGGEEIDFDGWNVEAVAGTGNKCLHGAPGISFVIARRPALSTRRRDVTSVYLDLVGHHRAQEAGSPQFTPAVQTLQALAAALGEFEAGGGWPGRHARYEALTKKVRSGLGEAGVQPLIADEDNSAVLSSFLLPDGVGFEALFDHLVQRRFVIYPGQRQLYQTIFRVAVMGDLTDADIDEFLAATTELLA